MEPAPSRPQTQRTAEHPTGFAAAWYLTGPTASGKTEVGLALAERIGAEILSLDSMSVYRGMDIGTAKPAADLRQQVPHHLLDLVEPWENFSVAQYVEHAARAVRQVQSRGGVPLFVGGTPLYLKALLSGLFAGPPADWTLRQSLEELARREGSPALHGRLAEVDPAAAARLHPQDVRRLVRALEVHQLTGRPISDLQTQWRQSSAAGRVFWLDWPRPVLYARINARVERMMNQGFVEEVRRLATTQHGLGRTAAQAVGYREILEYLRGQCDLPTAVDAIQRRTRRFARRQLTWLRSLGGARPIAVEEPFDPHRIAQRIAALGTCEPNE